MSAIADGYNVDNIEAPKFISRGEWDITGTTRVEAYWPLRAISTLESGAWGESGAYDYMHWCTPYDDISGISGCIGASIRSLNTTASIGTATTYAGTINQNVLQRKFAVMHEGYLPMYYMSGTLDGTPQTMTYGAKIAPCPSGFRTWEIINAAAVSGMDGTEVVAITTGLAQCELGWWADIPSNMTGERFRVKIAPHFMYDAPVES
jgi:hypothetical protein